MKVWLQSVSMGCRAPSGEPELAGTLTEGWFLFLSPDSCNLLTAILQCSKQHSQNATEGACQERLSVQLSALQKSEIRAEILECEPEESAICLFWQAHNRILLLGLPFCLLPPSLLLGFSCCHFMAFQQSWLGIFFSDVTYELFMGSRSTNFHRN